MSESIPVAVTPAAPEMKFYIAHNCNRRIEASGIDFEFEPVDYFGGTWRGLFVTVNPQAQAALLTLTSNPRNAVMEISREDYEKISKKKAPDALRNYSPLIPKTIIVARQDQAPQAIIPSNAIVVENPAPLEPEIKVTSEPLASVEEALTIGAVSVLRELKAKA